MYEARSRTICFIHVGTYGFDLSFIEVQNAIINILTSGNKTCLSGTMVRTQSATCGNERN